MTALTNYAHSAATRQILESLVPVVCPPQDADLGLTDAVISHVELSMRALPRVACLGLVAGLRSFDLAAMAWPANRGLPAHKLSVEKATSYFLAWLHSPVGLQRELARGVKGLMCMAHYEQPEVQARLGYTPASWITKVKTRRLEVYRDDIRRHEESITQPDPLPPAVIVIEPTKFSEEV